MVKMTLLGRVTNHSIGRYRTFSAQTGTVLGKVGWLVTLLLGDSTLLFEYASITGKLRRQIEYAWQTAKSSNLNAGYEKTGEVAI